MANSDSNMAFRFQYINQKGRAVGWRSAAGVLTERKIQLKEHGLEYRAVLNSTCRDRRLVLVVNPAAVEPEEIAKYLIGGNSLILEISGAQPLELEKKIDRISSHYLAESHRTQLEKEGKGREFRSVTCPHCESTVDLSLLNKTLYVYCRYCETVFQERSELKTVGTTYRLCDECGWFDRVQSHSEFFFYFLLVVYGFSHKRRHLCDTCVNRTFWKVLLINFIFILGIFPALWMKIKSLTGRDKALKELAKANAIAKKGKYTEAEAIYNRLYERYPQHPGILLSQSMGHLQGKDIQGTWQLLEKSLKSCSNYSPTVRLMNHIQEAATKHQS